MALQRIASGNGRDAAYPGLDLQTLWMMMVDALPAMQPQAYTQPLQPTGGSTDTVSTAITNIKKAVDARPPDANLIQKNIDALVAAVKDSKAAADQTIHPDTQDDPVEKLRQLLLSMHVDPATTDRILTALQDSINAQGADSTPAASSGAVAGPVHKSKCGKHGHCHGSHHATNSPGNPSGSMSGIETQSTDRQPQLPESRLTAAPAGGPSDTKPVVPITRTVEVHNATELKDALANATRGTEIKLADGVYKGNFELNNKNGVTISGSKNAILDSGGFRTGYGLHLYNSNNNTLTGFTVYHAKKGIILDGSSNNKLNGLTVDQIGQEGIHFRHSSSNNVLENSYIAHTGRTNPDIGEGVYIGAAADWHTNDHSDGNQILNNTFGEGITADNIDVKPLTVNGVISGNHFNTTGMRKGAASSAVSLKGAKAGYHGASGYLVMNNTTIMGPNATLDIGGSGNYANENTIQGNTKK